MARSIIFSQAIDDKELVTKLEATNYEVESRKEVIAFMLGSNYTNSEAFKLYQDEYQKFFMEYNLLKARLEELYVKPVVNTDQRVDWNLDFQTGVLTIYE